MSGTGSTRLFYGLAGLALLAGLAALDRATPSGTLSSRATAAAPLSARIWRGQPPAGPAAPPPGERADMRAAGPGKRIDAPP